MANTMDEKTKRILPTVTLNQSYKLCDKLVAERLGQFSWMVGNLTKEQRGHLSAVLALAARVVKLSDIHTGAAARLDQLEDFREDLRNNFMEEESTDQFPALLDTMKRCSIPQQYLHDIVAAADMCGRIDRIQSFDQWLQFGARLGGGTLLSCLPVAGFDMEGHEQAAIACGQAVCLTHLLADICDEIQKLEYYMPIDDIERFNVNLAALNPAKPSREMLRLIRLQVERIEELFHQGGSIVKFLKLDGQRVMKTVVSVYWNLLMKIKVEPEKFLQGTGDFTRKERFAFKLKHVLGLEGGVTVLPDPHDHDHH